MIHDVAVMRFPLLQTLEKGFVLLIVPLIAYE
jgi:hypothetical protein